jgi:hypothetical protein
MYRHDLTKPHNVILLAQRFIFFAELFQGAKENPTGSFPGFRTAATAQLGFCGPSCGPLKCPEAFLEPAKTTEEQCI